MNIILRRLLFGSLLVWLRLTGQVNVWTVNYDNNRTDSNLSETVLNPSSVSPASFGKLFTYPVDGHIYAQPLYVSGLRLPSGRVVNAVFTATMHDTVYAFDADAEKNKFNPVLWQVSLGTAVPSINYFSEDVPPEVGVLSTPVIDLSTGTLYVVGDTFENGDYFYRLHALDLATGAEKLGSPVEIKASVSGTGTESSAGIVSFDPFAHLQRLGLLLAGGVVYVGFGSHGDQGVYHGWLMGYDASNVTHQVSAFCVTPNGQQGALWQSGRGPVLDGDGNIYVETANGDFDGKTSFSQTFLKLGPQLNVLDWFTPNNWQTLDAGDTDVGSSGPVLIPGTKFLAGGGKEGRLYVIDKDSMGAIQAGDMQIVQNFAAVGFGIFTSALWNSDGGPVLYLQAGGDVAKAFLMDSSTGQFGETPISLGTIRNGTPYQGMAISANGGRAGSGILWMESADDTLHAYNASDLSQELWNSGMNYARDNIGSFAKFATPTVANGKVYVPTFAGQLLMYGLLRPELLHRGATP